MDDDDVILLSLVYIVDLFLCEWTQRRNQMLKFEILFRIVVGFHLFSCFYMYMSVHEAFAIKTF